MSRLVLEPKWWPMDMVFPTSNAIKYQEQRTWPVVLCLNNWLPRFEDCCIWWIGHFISLRSHFQSLESQQAWLATTPLRSPTPWARFTLTHFSKYSKAFNKTGDGPLTSHIRQSWNFQTKADQKDPQKLALSVSTPFETNVFASWKLNWNVSPKSNMMETADWFLYRHWHCMHRQVFVMPSISPCCSAGSKVTRFSSFFQVGLWKILQAGVDPSKVPLDRWWKKAV